MPVLTCGYGCGCHQDSFYNGYYAVDYALVSGGTFPIIASNGGTLTRHDEPGVGGGIAIVAFIDHGGGWRTKYAHLSEVRVRGQLVPNGGTIGVSQGETIGTSGDTGAVAVHLHFELRNGGGNYTACDSYTYSLPPFDASCCGCLPTECCVGQVFAQSGTGGTCSSPAAALPSTFVLRTGHVPQCSSPVIPRAPGAFNQNQVLCDNDLLDVGSMTEAQIQSLLDQRNSFFRDYYDPQTGELASHIIYTEAQNNQISPKLILAKMQQESSCIWSWRDMSQLVDPSRPELGTRADWVLFYGWPDSGPPNPAYKGFYNQVHNAAQSLRNWFDDPGSMGWAIGQPHAVSDGTVTPVNATTCALYIYTPWISSNNLLWEVWWMMWGDTGCSDGGDYCCGCASPPTAAVAPFRPFILPAIPTAVATVAPAEASHVSEPSSASSEAITTPQPTVDRAPPSPPDALRSVSHRPGVPSDQQRVELRWSAARDTDGSIAGYAITWDQSPDTVPAANLDLAGTAVAATSPPLETGRWYAHVRAVDAAGNASSPVHGGPFWVDVAAPAWPSSMQPVELGWQNEPQPPPISWPPAVDVGSGVAGYRVYYGEDAAGTGEATVDRPIFTPPVYDGPGDVTVRYLRVAPFDGAGTLGAWATAAVWQYDASRPVGALRVNNGGAVSRSLNVILHVPAHDTGSGVGSIRFRRDGMDWSDWEPYAPARAWTLENRADAQQVSAQLADRAGNVSHVYTAQVAVDLYASLPASDSYRLARSVVAMGGGVKSSTSYRVQGTSGQTTGVGMLQSAGYQVQSGFWHAAGSALLPLAAPSNLVAAPASAAAIDLAWHDNAPDETGYVIERSPNGTTAWTVAGMAAANATGYRDGGLMCAAAYFYRVRAYRAGDGQYSAYSNVATATTGTCQEGVHIYLPLALRSSISR